MLGPFFGKKLSFWRFLDFFTKQIKKSHKISNDGAQNHHQIYYKHLAIVGRSLTGYFIRAYNIFYPGV